MKETGTLARRRISDTHTSGCETVPAAPLPADIFEALVQILSDALIADMKEFPPSMDGSPRGSDHAPEAA